MPSTRYTVRLPPALDTAVQEYLRTTGTSFAVLIRQVLAAYLADTLPTDRRHPPTGALTSADSADRLQVLEAQMAEMTTRVKVIEEILMHWPPRADPRADKSADSPADREPTPADRGADTPPTGTDTPTPPRRPGRPSSPLRQQILDLLQAHPEGLRAEEIRVYVQARRPIGDLLQGMLKGGVLTAQGRGAQRRYVVSPAYAAPHGA
jgi:hypothetical protein